MIVTINGNKYETEDMTKEQRATVNEVQALENILRVISDEITIRQISSQSLVENKKAKVDNLLAELNADEKKSAKKEVSK